MTGRVIQRDPSGNIRVVGDVDEREYRLRVPGVATFAFRRGGAAVRVDAVPDLEPEAVEDLFRGTALPFFLQAEGFEALHASAVRYSFGVVAFCGFSGSGKTTIAYGLARRGQTVWADDVVLWSPNDTSPLSVQLPHALHLRAASRRFFGIDASRAPLPNHARPARERLRAVVVLEPAGDAAELVNRGPLPLGEGLTALLPHAFCFFPLEGREQRTAEAYLDLAARIPVYRLAYPRTFGRLDDVLDTVEAVLVGDVAG